MRSTHSRHRCAAFAAQPLTSPTKNPPGSSLHGSAAKPTVSRIIRKPLPPYTRGMFDILKAPLRGLRGSAAKPTVSHVIWKPPLLFLCGFAQPNTGGIWIRLHREVIQRGEIRTMCTNSNAQSHWRSSMRRPSGNRHTRDRVSVAVCGQRPKRATTDQRPTSMVASRAA